MRETAKKFAQTEAPEIEVKLYFQKRLKENFMMGVPGGRVQFNAMNYRVAPTLYRSK